MHCSMLRSTVSGFDELHDFPRWFAVAYEDYYDDAKHRIK
jgi:hypothetical protein